MLRDLRHAIRVLGKARGWTLVVLVSLALGIGANTALFSAVDGMLFRTLPVADPDGLVGLRWTGDNGAAQAVRSFGSTGGRSENGNSFLRRPIDPPRRDSAEPEPGAVPRLLERIFLSGLPVFDQEFRVVAGK